MLEKTELLVKPNYFFPRKRGWLRLQPAPETLEKSHSQRVEEFLRSDQDLIFKNTRDPANPPVAAVTLTVNLLIDQNSIRSLVLTRYRAANSENEKSKRGCSCTVRKGRGFLEGPLRYACYLASPAVESAE
jgi:hypothetical protein